MFLWWFLLSLWANFYFFIFWINCKHYIHYFYCKVYLVNGLQIYCLVSCRSVGINICSIFVGLWEFCLLSSNHSCYSAFFTNSFFSYLFVNSFISLSVYLFLYLFINLVYFFYLFVDLCSFIHLFVNLLALYLFVIYLLLIYMFLSLIIKMHWTICSFLSIILTFIFNLFAILICFLFYDSCYIWL